MSTISTVLLLVGVAIVGAGLLAMFLAICFRVVVSTNDKHVVQSAKKTVSYGKGQAAGNTYYKWPSWVPVIGVRAISLPMATRRPRAPEFNNSTEVTYERKALFS